MYNKRVKLSKGAIYRMKFFAVIYLFPVAVYGVLLSIIKAASIVNRTSFDIPACIVDSFFIVEHYSLLIAFLATMIFLNKLGPKIIAGFFYALVSVEMMFIVLFNAIYTYQIVSFIAGQLTLLIVGIVLAVKVILLEKSIK